MFIFNFNAIFAKMKILQKNITTVKKPFQQCINTDRTNQKCRYHHLFFSPEIGDHSSIDNLEIL